MYHTELIKILGQHLYVMLQKRRLLETFCLENNIEYYSKIWTLELCKIDALKYNTRTEWCNAPNGAYLAASKHGWLVECCKHMRTVVRWTLELCKIDVVQFGSMAKWRTASLGAYAAARRNGWLDECRIMLGQETLDSRVRWTFETFRVHASQFDSMSALRKNSLYAYKIARDNGWFVECCAHMTNPRDKPPKTPELCAA